jgi:3,4-dihydroxy 2-butanone 4-phosphate synthase/GTP cyclohydrolase II
MDLSVVEQVPIIAPPQQHRERYLATKRDKLGHLLPGMAEETPSAITEGD